MFRIELYVFRTVPLSIIRSFSLHTQQWFMSNRFADSLRAGSVPSWSCFVYNEKLLLLDTGTVQNMYSFISKINLRN